MEFVFSILVGAVADAPHFEGKNIIITYINGDKCPDNDKKGFETKITFICKPGEMVGFSCNHLSSMSIFMQVVLNLRQISLL